MNQTMVWMLVALGGEVLLLVFIALFVSWLRNRSARRRDLKAVRALVEKVKKGKADREALIGRFLDERMGLAGDVLDEARVTMLRAELGLLQRFAHVYSKRDAAAASRFDMELEAAIQPYHALSLGGEVQAAAVPVADESELERLRRENTRLSEELRITMETMSRMLNEYSAMFSPDSTATSAPIAAAVGGAGAAAALASGTADASPAGQSVPAEVDQSGADAKADDAFDIDLVSPSDDPEATPDVGQPEVSGSDDEVPFDGETAEQEPARPATDDDSDVPVAPQAVVEDDLSEVADLLAEVDAAAAVSGEPEFGSLGDAGADSDDLFGGMHAEAENADDAIDIGRGDDLDVHSEMLEEDAIEVVGFDASDDVALDEAGEDSVDDLFDELGEGVDAVAGAEEPERPRVSQKA